VGRYVEGDDEVELRERNRRKFERALPEYPLLARIFHMFEDYAFAPDELPKLREECLMVRSKTADREALRALRKLILASNEATKRGFSLMFICE
jgi:hypothetical protein